MLHVQALGTFDIRRGDEPLEGLLAQPKRAALLAYLVLARPRGFHRRDTLLALFWPDLATERARNALSQALTFLRRVLGDGHLLGRGADRVAVDPGLVRSDVHRFEAAFAAARWDEALAVYGGPLLPGLHVEGGELEPWLEQERDRLRTMAARAAWAEAERHLAAGATGDAERHARRALAHAPADESTGRAFMAALARAGDRAAALRLHAALATHLARELELEPDPGTQALARAIRAGEVPRGG